MQGIQPTSLAHTSHLAATDVQKDFAPARILSAIFIVGLILYCHHYHAKFESYFVQWLTS